MKHEFLRENGKRGRERISKLFYKGKPMKTEPVKDVLNSFIDWLPNDALLVAHNCIQRKLIW